MDLKHRPPTAAPGSDERRDPREATLNYGWGRLFLCYSLTPLLAKALGGRGRRYVETFIWLDLALLVTNVVIDRGPEGLRRLPQEMGLWPPRQRRHSPLS